MKINLNNYEEFFINYLDGVLTPEEIAEMEDFLLLNPDLLEELAGLEAVVLVPDETTYHPKDNLKQIDLSLPVTDENFEFFCIADQEEDLTNEQVMGLEQYLKQNSAKIEDREKFRIAHLVPDQSIIFPLKQKLYKSFYVVHSREIWTSLAFAAGIALLAGVYFGFVQNKIISRHEIVAVNPVEQITIDSTEVSTAKPPVKAMPAGSEKKPEEKKVLPPVSGKSFSKGISFKVEMPIASAGPVEKEGGMVDEQKILSMVKIDPEKINHYSVVKRYSRQEKLPPLEFDTHDNLNGRNVRREDYITLEQFAMRKFSSLVFGKEAPKEITIWNVVTAGIDKVNDLTGSNMKLERKTDQEGETRALKFNSKLLKINAPVNQDE